MRINVAWFSTVLIVSSWLIVSQELVWASSQDVRPACGQCEEPDRFVRVQDLSAEVRTGASQSFAHPFVLSPEEWTSLLRQLSVQRQAQGLFGWDPPGPVIPAFTAEEITYLSATLSKVFAHALPHEWVVFGLSRPTSQGITRITTGGWFLEGGELHFVLANYRKAVTMQSIRDALWANPVRSDEGTDYAAVAGPHQSIVRVSRLSSRFFAPSPSELAISYQAALSGTSSEGSGSSFSPPSSPNVGSTPVTVEERLRLLKQLQAQGLITEDDYRTKKQQILDHF